ncbi:hypothetical protein [Nostoc sp.]|uniref:hypothetical protein n=1 Tax=Nostoc sp. TaxID=1180 RepID=UPI002FFB01C6
MATATRTPINFDVLPQIKQGISSTQTPVTQAPIQQQQRPIEYHAEPKNIPDIQQKIKNNEPIISGAKSQFSVYQDPTLPQGVTQADVEGTAAVGKFLLGVGDQISGKNTLQKNDYQVRNNQRYIFTPLENFSYDVGRRTGDGAQGLLGDLWKHRPQFEIPTIKIPKFTRPGLPDIFKPKPKQSQPQKQDEVIPGQPKPRVEEPKPRPLPEPNEKDIPEIEKERKKYPIPDKKPGSQRFKIPVLCDCAASLSFGTIVTGNSFDGSIQTSPGLSYMAYLANGRPAPDGATEYNPRYSGDYFDVAGEKFFVNAMAGSIPDVDGIFVYYFSVTVGSNQQGDGYVDLVMPTYKGKEINWGYIWTTCLGCEPRPPSPENPPPPPPKDCECMSKCCPDIDYRKIQKMIEDAVAKADITAAIPLSFQIRHEGDTPQMIIQCAERKGAASGDNPAKYDSAKYPITVPHWKGGQNDKPSLPPYKKGNWEGILVLKDNSKVTINAQSESECKKMLNAIKPWIKSDMLEGSYFKGGLIVTDEPIKQIQVYPKYGRYFSKGQKNNRPDWRVDFP